MGILRSQEDSFVKEMAKFEQRDVVIHGTLVQAIDYADGGRKGAPFAEYPKAVYRAESAEGGPRICAMKSVKDESDERIAVGQGWRPRQEDALALVEENQRELARLAANRAHNDKWMSEAARAEAQAADESTLQHLAAIPDTPIVRRQPKEAK